MQRILVAEDEPEVRDYLELSLRCHGYEVEQAEPDEHSEAWIKAVLANDETSTDEELRAYFIENGVKPADVDQWIVQREEYLKGKL
jgi:CheY-like chemotaxis protein